jgi:hypothetical protein
MDFLGHIWRFAKSGLQLRSGQPGKILANFVFTNQYRYTEDFYSGINTGYEFKNGKIVIFLQKLVLFYCTTIFLTYRTDSIKELFANF